jgi:hypothetical protein
VRNQLSFQLAGGEMCADEGERQGETRKFSHVECYVVERERRDWDIP